MPLVIAVLVAGLSTTAAAAAPESGTCRNPHFIPIFERIEWGNGTARVHQIDAVLPGRLVGPFEEEDGWRMSVFFEDPVLGSIEVVIFQSLYLPPRLGMVGFNDHEGETITGFIQGYTEADCRLE